MKAADIFMWLLIFNLVLWLLGGYGLNIYGLGTYSEGIEIDTHELNASQQFSAPNEDVKSRAEAFLWDVTGFGIFTIVGMIAGSAIIGYLLQAKTSSQGIVIGAFSGVFWYSYVKTIQVFFGMTDSFASSYKITIFGTIFLIFTGICAFVFIFGVMQMATGGWRFFK